MVLKFHNLLRPAGGGLQLLTDRKMRIFLFPRSSSTLAEFLPSHLGGCQAATEGKFLALTLQQSERPAASDSKSSGCNFGPGNLGSGWSTRPKFTLFCCECKLCLWRKAKMGDGGSYCIPAIVPEKRGCYHRCLNFWQNICQTFVQVFLGGRGRNRKRRRSTRPERRESRAHMTVVSRFNNTQTQAL